MYGENSIQINTTLTIFTLLISIVSLSLSRIPVSDPEKDIREKAIQELTIEEKKLAIEEKRLILEKLHKEIEKGSLSPSTLEKAAKAAEFNLKIQTKRSNFYKQLGAYEKVTAVSFSASDISGNEIIKEHLVPRAEFPNYVLADNNLPIETVDSAIIEIVAPVLKEGNYKWKGIYEGETINFSMSDADFKNDVLNERVAFQHGTRITCVLQIHRKINELGDADITGYSVITVIDKTDSNSTIETLQGKKYREYKKFTASQKDLFSI